VIVSLTLAAETCSAALTSLASNSQSHGPDSPPIDTLQKDLTSLLTLLHSSTTKCTLTLKPSSPTYQAALSPLKDLSSHTAALTHCAQLFSDEIHGATLTKEVASTARDVIEAIAALVHTFLALQADPGNGTGKAGEEYMVRTGGVHDLIDKAKGAKGLSKDNLGAVRKKWGLDRGMLEDAVREVGEMVEEEKAGDEGDGGGDGWDELGIGKKMDQKELERTKQV
jgi:cyclin-D1-binding protein 1